MVLNRDHRLGAHAVQSVRVGLVQNNLGLEKWRRGGLERSFITLEQLSRAAAAQRPDLLVWPETAVPCRVRTREDCRSRVEDLVAELGVPVLTGASDADPRTREPYNAAFYFSGKPPLQRYAKMHLVPFGERTPFMDFVPLLRDIDWTALTGDLGPAEFARGRERTLFEHPRGDFAVLICFESVFPDLVRGHVAGGADFLVVITNDSWFGRTAGPYQHAQLAVFRAVENRTAIARCATSGVSLFVDRYGRTSQSTPVFTQAHAGRRPRHRVARDLLHPPRRPVRPAGHRGCPHRNRCGVPARAAVRIVSFEIVEMEPGIGSGRGNPNAAYAPMKCR